MEERWRTHVIDVASANAADPDPLLLREWLITNGSGAYASGTAAGCNTRRYHGLLIASTRSPVARISALAQMWEQLVLSPAGHPGVAEQTLDFSTLLFRGMSDGSRTFAPRGVALLRTFERGLSVRWRYAWGRIGFERELFLHWRQSAITLRYRVTGLDEANMQARLRLQPMVTLRDHHGLRKRERDPGFELDDHRREYFTVADPTTPDAALTFLSSHGDFSPNPHWWQAAYLPAEEERGQEDWEDYFVPAKLQTLISDEAVLEVTAALGREPVDPIGDTYDREDHLRPMAATLAIGDGLETTLAIAADDFVAQRSAEEPAPAVLAGFPWLSEFGRDTLVALPGLLLCTGRGVEAREVLRRLADHLHEGLIPHRLDSDGTVDARNSTADTSLWYVHAALQYVHMTGDIESWRGWLAGVCLRVIDAYIVGTAHGIVMDTDGLIVADDASGGAGPLTWMDAKLNEHTFTPRRGKPVEVNALWHSALCGLAQLLENREVSGELADRFGDASQSCGKLAERVAKNFASVFWNEAAGCLFDCVAPGLDGKWYGDPAIRPNQVFAVGLPHPPLTGAKARRVLDVVRERLLTPVGLHTLAPGHPAYRGRYTGELYRRDEAYHNGTVWPWLIGTYVEAVLRVNKFSRRSRNEAAEALAPLMGMLTTSDPPSSLGQLNEVFDGDAILPADVPSRGHRPVGAIARAWSVAEVIRARHLLASGE